MYIQPNSDIYVMSNVPLNNGYKDTMFFYSLQAQTGFFEPYIKYRFTEQYYQRVHKNKCRVKINAEQLYDCNYLSFKNNSFGDKKFYAFITNVEYVNHNVSEITYEIDIIQTWFFETELGMCYVEREHASSDQVGEHLLPEPVEIDEYVVGSQTTAGLNQYSIFILTSQNIEPDMNAGLYNGMFGCGYLQFPLTVQGASDCDNALQRIVGSLGGDGAKTIVSVYIGPSAFPPQLNEEIPTIIPKILSRPRTIAGFEPNNNKLLTSPYTFLNVDCLNDNKNYMYEYFGDIEPVFSLIGSSYGNPSVLCVPQNYKINGVDNYCEQIVMGGYPLCVYPIDTVKNWLANSAVHQVISGISIPGALAYTTSNPAIIAASVGTMLASSVKLRMETMKENSFRGEVTTNVNVQNKSKDIYFRTMTLRYEKAKSIDEFFSRYGYTCERVKVPNRDVRKRWCYTKTSNCIVKGNLPADDAYALSKIYDNGLTFWKQDLGNYVFNDNPPV